MSSSIHFVFRVSNFCSHPKIPLNYTKFNTLESNLINWYVNAYNRHDDTPIYFIAILVERIEKIGQ